jgi:hypothetical protein
MRRVVLVTGPPCAGKTTHVRAHAGPTDLVLDQDVMGKVAMRTALARLPYLDGTAWVIRCAPGPKARRQLAQQLGATEHIHLVQPEHTLVQRAAHRPNPRRHIAAVAQWFKREREDRAPATPRASRTRGSSTQRGYGKAHRQARADALRDLEDGQACARCGQPMYRTQASHLDLDHTDDRTAYRGLAHRACNRRAGQAKATANRHHTAPTQATPRSRSW